MIRTTERTSLESDDAQAAEAARDAGWRIDTDLWWVRPRRDGDAPDTDDGMVMDRFVFVASAKGAVDYDSANANTNA